MSRRQTYQQQLTDYRRSESIIVSGISESLSILIRLSVYFVTFCPFVALFLIVAPGFELSFEASIDSIFTYTGTLTVLAFHEGSDFTKPPEER